jgi:hemerythrin-like domain-containing protein
MRATEILKEEHVILERVLVALDLAAVGSAHQKPVRPGFFIDTYGFVLDFTEGFHFKKEEEILYRALEDVGLPVEGGQLGILMNEHEESRRYIRAMLTAAKEWDAGDVEARAEVIWATSGYTGLLHQHIARENTILFSLAKQMLSEAVQEQISQVFEQSRQTETGEDVLEKYLKIAIKLEKEASSWK